MICCQFIFKPGTYDDLHRLDEEIDDYACSMPGLDRVKRWFSPDGDVVNAMAYSPTARPSSSSDAPLSTARPRTRSRVGTTATASSSPTRATYGDGCLPAPRGASRVVDDIPDQAPDQTATDEDPS